jgi:hypothetical protein
MPLSRAGSFCIVSPSHTQWFAAIGGEHGWHSACSPQGLALLVISSNKSAIEHKAQHDDPRVPPLGPGMPRVGVILLGLLGFFKPSMSSGRTTT